MWTWENTEPSVIIYLVMYQFRELVKLVFEPQESRTWGCGTPSHM